MRPRATPAIWPGGRHCRRRRRRGRLAGGEHLEAAALLHLRLGAMPLPHRPPILSPPVMTQSNTSLSFLYTFHMMVQLGPDFVAYPFLGSRFSYESQLPLFRYCRL